MDSYFYLCIVLVVECVVFVLCLKYNILTTYRPVISKILDAIQDGQLTKEEIEQIREAIDEVLKSGNS